MATLIRLFRKIKTPKATSVIFDTNMYKRRGPANGGGHGGTVPTAPEWPRSPEGAAGGGRSCPGLRGSPSPRLRGVSPRGYRFSFLRATGCPCPGLPDLPPRGYRPGLLRRPLGLHGGGGGRGLQELPRDDVGRHAEDRGDGSGGPGQRQRLVGHQGRLHGDGRP